MVACRLTLNRIFIWWHAVPIRVSPLALALLVAMMLPSVGGAQVTESAPGPTTQPIADTGGEGRPLVQLGPGDSVTLSVFGQPEMNTTDFVADDGTITVPLAGPVPVRGLSPTEAARRIEQALRDRKILVDPHVTISAVVSRSQRVSVLGEVHKPGRYVIDRLRYHLLAAYRQGRESCPLSHQSRQLVQWPAAA
jgi:protein involved in polysaccharide export with SLBB domain